MTTRENPSETKVSSRVPVVVAATAAQSEAELNDDSFELARRLSELLSQFSKSAQKSALTMVTATMGKRVVPIGIPLGSTKSEETDSAKSRKGKRPREEKSSWKRDARWVALQKERSTIVGELKPVNDGEDRRKLVSGLRDVESRLRDLKCQLRS
jgi:hypothetical protein